MESSDYDSDEEISATDIATYGQRVAVGTLSNCTSNMLDTLNSAAQNHQDFVCIPLFHPRFRTDSFNVSDIRQGFITRSDMALDDQDWTSNVIGLVSNWINTDSTNSEVRIGSEIALKREYLYASHLGLQAVIINMPANNNQNFARCLASITKETPPTSSQVWIRVQLQYPQEMPKQQDGCSDFNDGWNAWDSFRHHTQSNPRFHIALELPTDLRSVPLDSIARWAAEPVKAVIMSYKCFGTNKQGNKPKLSHKFQFILQSLFKYNIHVILSGKPSNGIRTGKYLQYIEQLCAAGIDGKGQGPFSLYDRFSHPFRDSLQSPLHPLSDNLDSETYRVMEKDPVKYSQYEAAITQALRDIHKNYSKKRVDNAKKRKLSGNNNKVEDGTASVVAPIVVMVVGAGRGPLVQATLNASEKTNIEVKVYAVEKNFNAVVTLRNRFFEPIVTVLSTDMRDLRSLATRLGITLSVDVIVSELLGSWGDNELSPECLDTVQDLLRPDTGVMIPQNYESYVAPIASSKMWTNARDMMHFSDIRSGLDSPYVVHFHSCKVLADAKPLFKFVHPNPELGKSSSHNARYATVTFDVAESVTVHGLAGYFDCVLYKDITFSTVPATHSEGMFSWFPLFIPLRIPLRVNAGDVITVCIWRCVGSDKVWYEWCLAEPTATAIQNSGGVSYHVKL